MRGREREREREKIYFSESNLFNLFNIQILCIDVSKQTFVFKMTYF